MKFSTRNQTTLKMLLLLALVGNISYEPLSRQFKSINLSQVSDETRSGDGGTAAPQAAPAAPAEQQAQSDSCGRASTNPNPYFTATRNGNGGDLPKGEAANGNYLTFKPCNIEVLLNYREVCNSDGSWSTTGEAWATERNRKIRKLELHTVSGKYVENWQSVLDEAKELGTKYCEDERQVQKCSSARNNNGELEDLHGVDRIQCLASMDKAAMKAAGLDANDIGEIVEKESKDIESEVKDKLRSEDDSEYDEGVELASDLQDALSDVKDVTKSNKSVNGVIKRLKAYRETGDKVRETRKYGERLESSFDSMDERYEAVYSRAIEAKALMDQGVPGAQFQYMNAMNEAQSLNLQNGVYRNQIESMRSPFLSLKARYADTDIMSMSDLESFWGATPYESLANRYNDYTNGLSSLLGVDANPSLIDVSSFDSMMAANPSAMRSGLTGVRGLGTLGARGGLARGAGFTNYDSLNPIGNMPRAMLDRNALGVRTTFPVNGSFPMQSNNRFPSNFGMQNSFGNQFGANNTFRMNSSPLGSANGGRLYSAP